MATIDLYLKQNKLVQNNQQHLTHLEVAINILLSIFNVNALVNNKTPINNNDKAKLILKNGKFIGNKSNTKQSMLTSKTE